MGKDTKHLDFIITPRKTVQKQDKECHKHYREEIFVKKDNVLANRLLKSK